MAIKKDRWYLIEITEFGSTQCERRQPFAEPKVVFYPLSQLHAKVKIKDWNHLPATPSPLTLSFTAPRCYNRRTEMNMKTQFNIDEHFTELMRSVGLEPSDTGGTITFVGEDPIFESRVRLGAAYSIPYMGTAAAGRGGHHLAP